MEEEIQNNNNPENIEDQTGNMYSYHDDSHQEPPKESNAIRRSIGNGANPNLNAYQNNIPIDNIQNPVIGQFGESNAVRRSLGEGKNPNAQNYPSYIDNKSSEFRLPKLQDNKTQYYMGPPMQEVNPIYRPQPREPKKLYILTFFIISIFHIIVIFLLFFCFEFPTSIDDTGAIKENYFYHFFKDVHIMLFIGFGMLYTLLKDHQWSSVALTLFMGTISIEFSLLCYFLWYKLFKENKWEKVSLDFNKLTSIDYFSTTVIITLGAVIGKLSISQYFVICLFETFFASLNYFLCYEKINFLDNGGSLFIHTFGGTFGVVLSVILFCRENEFTSISNNIHLSNDYYSSIFSFIGTIFLWIFFPSFNVANIQYKEDNNNEKNFSEVLRYRGIINTYLSMVGSLIGTFVFNPMIHNGKIKVEHLLNSAYVGGIIIGGCCTICTSAWASILIGFIGGSISAICLWKIKSLFKKNKLEDTFGILHTFTIPGILGGFLTCIFIANLKDKEGETYYEDLRKYIFGEKDLKSESVQAGLQVAATCVTLAIAGLSGIITGFVVYSVRCEKNEIYFVDSELFTEDENIPLPEWKYPRQNDSNLSSSGNKLDEQGREVQIEQV